MEFSQERKIMAERLNMTEGSGPGPGPEGASPVGEGKLPGNVESQPQVKSSGESTPQRPWHVEPEYDPERKDYVTQVEIIDGKESGYNLIIDPLTNKEVARVLTIVGEADTKGSGSPETSREVSAFRKTLANIIQADKMPTTTPQEAAARQAALEAARRERDKILQDANNLGLFDSLKAELSGVYYGSRVRVTKSVKEGTDRYEGQGKLQELLERQQVAYDSRRSLETDSVVIRIDSAGRRTEEAKPGFWSDSQHPERKNLEQTYRGVVDYLNQKSIDMILAVVRNRKIYTLDYSEAGNRSYPSDGIVDIWNGAVRDTAGNILKDEDGQDIIAGNFNEVREAIEEARRQEPWVPNRQDYETWIKFVADDVEELEEMIPYIVAKVKRKLGTGEPNAVFQTLQQEKEKMDKALVAFPTESEQQFRRLKSTLAANLNLMGAHFFSDQVRKDWQPYLHYMEFLASACQDTEYQDHLVDSLILDKDGLTMLAADQFSQEDGIFWRYGEKAADINIKAFDIGKLYRRQERMRGKISKELLGKKLRKMSDLLNLEVDKKGDIVRYGDPKHPAFQRLKKLFDEEDQADQSANNSNILDADGEPTLETRWMEYCRKALDWQNTGKFGDPREAERVTFQHPLARAFKPPIKNSQGGIYDEFQDMFEEDKQVDNDKWYASTKRRKIKSIMEKAERIARAFMLDSVAALAWHIVPVKDKANPTPEESAKLADVKRYLTAAGMEPITFDEAVPHTTLYRAMMQAVIREDRNKVPARKAFKFHYLLTERLGLDLDLPIFASWYLGAHDTGRPAVILQAIAKHDQEAIATGNQAASLMMREGEMDEKNTGAARAERERRIGLLMQMVIKAKFGEGGRYFNFPGYDTRGAGVKDIRNNLNPMYGISRDTVWLSDLIKDVILGEQEFSRDHGCTRSPITQLVGLWKGSNEVVFKQSGYTGIIESPRDFESWVKRFGTAVEQYKAFTSGDKEGFALLNDGPLSGGYRWRDYNLSHIDSGYMGQPGKYFAVNNPAEAINTMKEATYRAGVDLAKETIAPLIRIMKNTVDSTFGKNPGSARFLNTLLWYAVSKWMDTSWEFRQKPGYAVDANLHTARYFMHQYLLEYGSGGLIYTDQEWDEIMLGYVLKADGTKVVRYEVDSQGNTRDAQGNILLEENSEGNIINSNGDIVYSKDPQGKLRDAGGIEVNKDRLVLGKIYEGLVDVFPKDLKDEILKGKDLEVRNSAGQIVKAIPEGDYMLPFGLQSKYPETFANYYRDSDAVQRDYVGALGQITPRKKVRRP